MRLGIVRLSAIGDVVHAMPLAMGLRRKYPRAKISWVVQRGAAPLLEGHPAVDDIVLFPRRGGPRRWWRFVRELRRRRFDVTVDPQGNLKSGLVGLLSGASVRAGLHPRYCKERSNALLTNRHGRMARGLHAVDRAWTAGAPVGVAPPVAPAREEWGLSATAAERQAWRERCSAAGADPDGPILAVHLTDPADARSWFAESWAELAWAMAKAGWQVVLNGQQRQLAAEIGGPGVHDLTNQDDVRGLVAQYECMAERAGNRLLTPDSGPAHIAAAVGLNVLCLSGPQDPARTGPRTGDAIHAWEGLSCAPCLERDCIRKPPDRACMRDLSPQRVVERLLKSG